MSDFSDTESESDASAIGWDAADFVQMAMELGRIDAAQPETLDPSAALEALRNLDICAVEHDERLLAVVQRVSNNLLSFLDSVNASVPDHPCTNEPRSIHAHLLALLNESSMALLLQYRALFRAIASRNTSELSSAIPVCWVDVVLAKLGEAIIHAAGIVHGVRPLDVHEPTTVRAQKADDMLRAAVQLPATWLEIQQVLRSDYASPAAIRLASSLVWGVAVMALQVAGSSLAFTQESRGALFAVLQDAVKRRSSSMKRAQELGMHPYNASEHERVAYAMLVSLYANLDTFGDSLGESPHRPYSHAALLEMINVVLHVESVRLDSSPPTLAREIDVPTSILFKWGRSLPWAWGVWKDPRLYQSDVVEYLTATWLHHLDTPVIDMPSAHSVDWWDDQLVAALERDQFAALSMLSRVVMRHLSDSPALGVSDDIAMDVLLKACWGVKHILQSIHPDDSSLAWVLAKMYQLFFSLGGRELDLAVKDLIIEILSLSPGNLCLALASTSESRSEYANGWERTLADAIKCCREDSFRDNPPALALHSIRQSLQLLTLLAAADCTPTGVVVEMIRRFFSGLLDWLRSEWRDYYIWDSLGGATLTALSMLAGTSLGDLVTGLGTDSVWDVVGDADLLNLPLAASVSAYYAAINNSSKAHDILACAEVWTYLQDVLLLVLNREFSGDEEPLALLVSPILCRTLSSILQHAPPGFERYIKTSPWTGCLLTLLHGVVKEPEGVDEYDRVLHELIGPLAADICRRLQKSPGTDTAEAERVKADLTFCWSGGRACLIPC